MNPFKTSPLPAGAPSSPGCSVRRPESYLARVLGSSFLSCPYGCLALPLSKYKGRRKKPTVHLKLDFPRAKPEKVACPQRQETLLLGGLPLPGWCGLVPGHGVELHTKGMPWGITIHNMTPPPNSNIPTLGGSKEGVRNKTKGTALYSESPWMVGEVPWDTELPWGNEICPHKHHTGCMEESGTPHGGDIIMHSPGKLPLPHHSVLWAREATGELGPPAGREKLYSFNPAVGTSSIALHPLPSHSPFQILSGVLWLWSGGVGSGEKGGALLLKWYKKTAPKSWAPGPLHSVLFVFGWDWEVGGGVGGWGRWWCGKNKFLTQKSHALYICKNSCSLLLGRAALPSTPAPPTWPGRLVKENLFSLQKPL